LIVVLNVQFLLIAAGLLLNVEVAVASLILVQKTQFEQMNIVLNLAFQEEVLDCLTNVTLATKRGQRRLNHQRLFALFAKQLTSLKLIILLRKPCILNSTTGT
jgi:hypothetical protein